MKYLRPFLENLQNMKTDEEEIKNILIDLQDHGCKINIQSCWTKSNFNPVYTNNNGHEDEDDDFDYDDEGDEDLNDESYSLPKKGLTKTYRIDVSSKEIKDLQKITDVSNDIQTAFDRLSDHGKAFFNYNIDNGRFDVTLYLKTNEESTIDVKKELEDFIIGMGLKIIPPRRNSPSSENQILIDYLTPEEKILISKHKAELKEFQTAYKKWQTESRAILMNGMKTKTVKAKSPKAIAQRTPPPEPPKKPDMDKIQRRCNNLTKVILSSLFKKFPRYGDYIHVQAGTIDLVSKFIHVSINDSL